MLSFFKKLFIEESYAIGWRITDCNSSLPVDGVTPRYHLIRGGQTQWWADPFPFELDGKFYIFVELFKRFRGKGSIACFEINKHGEVVWFNEVLVEPFHLSYPNVFRVDGTIYMIPESEKANQIRLYRAKRFPDIWEFDHVLACGRRFVDSSIMFDDKGIPKYLFSQDFSTKELLVFSFNTTTMQIVTCENNPKLNAERCGGNCLSYNGDIIRVLQDCSRMYGERILFSRLKNVDLIESGLAHDEPLATLTTHDISFDFNRKFERIHTFNRSAHHEVIDVFDYRFVLSKPIRKLYELLSDIKLFTKVK